MSKFKKSRKIITIPTDKAFSLRFNLLCSTGLDVAYIDPYSFTLVIPPHSKYRANYKSLALDHPIRTPL